MDAAITFNHQAKASVRCRVWDIVGKVANPLPLHQIWGGRVRTPSKSSSSYARATRGRDGAELTGLGFRS